MGCFTLSAEEALLPLTTQTSASRKLPVSTLRGRLACRCQVTRTQLQHLGRFVIKHSCFLSFGPPVYPSSIPSTCILLLPSPTTWTHWLLSIPILSQGQCGFGGICIFYRILMWNFTLSSRLRYIYINITGSLEINVFMHWCCCCCYYCYCYCCVLVKLYPPHHQCLWIINLHAYTNGAIQICCNLPIVYVLRSFITIIYYYWRHHCRCYYFVQLAIFFKELLEV